MKRKYDFVNVATTAIVPCENLRKMVSRGLNSDEVAGPNLLAIQATVAVYKYVKHEKEGVFGHLKNVFSMRRLHLRGQVKVENDLGLMLMTINLKKYW